MEFLGVIKLSRRNGTFCLLVGRLGVGKLGVGEVALSHSISIVKDAELFQKALFNKAIYTTHVPAVRKRIS